ncbi:hypothetical protein BCR37DRAFT_386100 [Protomyces lactucae-debilis]|uniref:Uncharacterized protein n=1 Tax=Protomyces lactucae-debilis TaxID=2754530 RepID=A0A1Y2FP60_PROLT|nr:uncharacterized protein BCR37DRAFT_386100 [Protomyces lactucae-debilis]ORY85719.1 hypothetical protein BCR37DRAFT_386100 [Protomyces lactucae-debilis]
MYGRTKKRAATVKQALPTQAPRQRKNEAIARLEAALAKDELQIQGVAWTRDDNLRWSAAGSFLEERQLQLVASQALQRQQKRWRQKESSFRSLKELCAIQLAVHIAALTPEVLGCLAVHQARLVWQAMQALLPSNLKVWILFASAFPHELHLLEDVEAGEGILHPLVARRTHVGVRELPQCLDFLANPTASSVSATPSWQVLLDVSGMPIPVDMALQFGTIKNLLVLMAGNTTIDVSTVRHWCRAQSVGRFADLQLLQLESIAMPWAVMMDLVAFPALQLVSCRCTASWPPWIRACLSTAEGWQNKVYTLKQTPCLDIFVHLGSRADKRPTLPRTEGEVYFVDMSKVRRILAGLQKDQPAISTAPVVSTVRKKRTQQLSGRNILQGVL